MMSKVGFCMALIGVGGLAEAYGNTKQLWISLLLIGAGAVLMRMENEKDIDRRTDRGNILDRLRFLP